MTARPDRPASDLQAGAGRAVIEIPAPIYPVDGFGSEADPLEARVLVLERSGRRVVLAVLDQTSLGPESITSLARLIAAAAQADAADVLVGVSHTFSAPHVRADAGPNGSEQNNNTHLQHALAQAVAAATQVAVDGLRPARMGWSRGQAAIAVNRDVQTPFGSWLGADARGPRDPTVTVVKIEGDDGRPLAVLLGHAVQPSVMNESVSADGHRLVTGDLAGAAVRHVERTLGAGCVAFFLIGAAGDQAPLLTAVRDVVQPDGRLVRADAGDAALLLVQLLGERLGAEAVRLAAGIEVGEVDRLEVTTHAVTVAAQVADPTVRSGPSTTYPFPPDGEVDVPFWVVHLGPLALVGLQAELSSTTALDLRARTPEALIVTMLNGAAKYLPDAHAYHRTSYEARSSRYASGSAEAVADAIVAELGRP